jgi:(E)-4-hydroxy-3-methylbut-2-enyl-diphosphate synthase
MTNTATTDMKATLRQVEALMLAGCDIVRVSVPDMDAARAFGDIKRHSMVPLVADIHFDHRLALEAMAQGADGIRINPGNIGGEEGLRLVAREAVSRRVPVRVGVNLGSVRRSVLARHEGDHVGAIVESAGMYVGMLEDLGLEAIKVSLKSSDVLQTIDAYRRFSKMSLWPLHLGVTEAGPLISGLVRSSVGIGVLLEEGLGDTVRVSLSADPLQEVFAGRILLECLGIRAEGVRVIACPMCARACADVAAISSELEDALRIVRRHVVVAVMGCVVNGPGEARMADIGVACDAKGAVLFRKGKPIRRIQTSEIIGAVQNELDKEMQS